MGEGRVKESWNHTADLMALIANIHRDSEAWPQPFVRSDFHPYYESTAVEHDIDDCDISVLKVFLPS